MQISKLILSLLVFKKFFFLTSTLKYKLSVTDVIPIFNMIIGIKSVSRVNPTVTYLRWEHPCCPGNPIKIARNVAVDLPFPCRPPFQDSWQMD